MQEKTEKAPKKRVLHPKYVSQNQLIIPGFETPFEQEIDYTNRWVRLAKSNTMGCYCLEVSQNYEFTNRSTAYQR